MIIQSETGMFHAINTIAQTGIFFCFFKIIIIIIIADLTFIQKLITIGFSVPMIWQHTVINNLTNGQVGMSKTK